MYHLFSMLFILLLFVMACDPPINSEDDVAIYSDSVIYEEGEELLEQIIDPENNSKMKTWDWAAMNLPAHPWVDETVLGSNFNVDSAYDPEAVKLTGRSIRFFIDPLNPSTDEPGHFNYRAELHTMPWPINHELETEQWLGWKYTFGDNYVIDKTSPITIFQNHPGVNGLSPQIELEIAALNDPSPALGGEIQIINVPNNDRIVTEVKPVAGDDLEVVIQVVYGLEDTGLLRVWLNGTLYYDQEVSTVYEDHPWGGNNKWGIYHHTLNGSEQSVVETVQSGARNVELFMGTLKTWTRKPGHPKYKMDAYELIRPEN